MSPSLFWFLRRWKSCFYSVLLMLKLFVDKLSLILPRYENTLSKEIKVISLTLCTVFFLSSHGWSPVFQNHNPAGKIEFRHVGNDLNTSCCVGVNPALIHQRSVASFNLS